MMMGFAMNAAVMPKTFDASLRRLLRTLRPERPLIVLVLILGVASVVFVVLGPKILGNALNILFDGLLGKQIPAGISKEQAVAGLRAGGQDRIADMLASANVTPGQGVDFGALGGAMLLLIGLYALSALFAWAQSYLMAGV
ncbi:MAG: ABC transporter ATP-binding protein, partial [Actinobacteria bacterium]|nr:ABC transporter ATP-binding protein [Actinomycetota bacterium]